jgi:hypothetical protein
MLSGMIGMWAFLAFIPFSIIATLGWACALGLIGMIFGKHDDRSGTKRFFYHLTRGWWWLIALLWISPWMLFGFIQFTNNVAPATLPKITLSNGEKTVIFQSMMHIGSPWFYEDIRQDMERLKGQDYVFFYEGVRAGTPESIEKLSELMGMNVSEKMYRIFAEMGGLITQNGDVFLGILPSTNVDLSTDEIITLAGEQNIVASGGVANENIIDVFEKSFPSMNAFQKNIIRIMSRGMMNILLRTYTNPALTQELQSSIPVFDIILHQRNDLVVESIIASPIPNIYIHYGALHYEGIFAKLKEKDPRWQEIARTELQVIR